MKTIITEFEEGTGRLVEKRYHLNGRLHRDPVEGPAHIVYADDGSVAEERYYWKGELHREDGPAEIIYNILHEPFHQEYFQNGSSHRDPKEGPSLTERDGSGFVFLEGYYFNNQPCRDPADGPWWIERGGSGEVIEELYLDARPSEPSSVRSVPATVKPPTP